MTLDKKNATEGLIKIILIETDYQPKVEEKVRDYARKANIKGFRPGKVPGGVIRRMYGKSILVDEINSLLSASLNTYIKDNNLKLIGDPLPNSDKANHIDWDNQKDFEFEYQVGMVADFTCDVSDKVKVKRHVIEVDKKVLDETLQDVRKQFGEVSYPETSESGDVLTGILSNQDGSWSKEVSIATDKVEKKEQKKFAGLKKDDVVNFEIQKAITDEYLLARLLDLSVEKAKEAKGSYTFTISSISRSAASEMNQELFDKVFGKDAVKTEEEFINKVKETVEGNYSRESDFMLENDIRETLIKNTKIEIPEGFLKTWLKATGEGKITDEVLEREFESYKKGLLWDLIRNKVAEDNKIEIGQEEIKQKAKEMIAAQFGGAAIIEQLGDKMDAIAENYLSGENGENYMRVYRQLHSEKIMGLIKEKISISDKKVSLDEFKKLAQN
ncbi:MAG TPA: trigger factor [Cyclobacteriaceae bacterium]|nr:trigger factor [Cyclobacteriaceae bacterium]